MENFKQLITSQAEALKKDIAVLAQQIDAKEVELDELKAKKSECWKVLRGIEKKLAAK